MQPDAAGSIDVSADVLTGAIQRSLDAWRAATSSCAFLTLNYVAPAPLEAHLDGVNTIKFRSDKWCHPDDKQLHDACYDSIAAGITTVFYADHPGQKDDGTMLDTDIELNEINFTFDVVDPVSGPTRMPRAGTSTIADLENTLVHELGHVQGLDHTCIFQDSAATALETDETGQKPPYCDKLGQLSPEERVKILSATMFASAGPAEIIKRTPEADDIAGICNAYPVAMNPMRCEAPDVSAYTGSGCQIGQGSQVAGIWAAILLALAAWLVRRRVAAAVAVSVRDAGDRNRHTAS
jgi:hypothetical protein